MQRIFIQNHTPISFEFRQNRYDFIVDEIASHLKDVKKGSYIIYKIKKQDLSTIEMINDIEAFLNEKCVGYAGLKDKYATTTQYISLPQKLAKSFARYHHKNAEVLEQFKAKSKLSIGDLEANRFRINLKEVTPQSAKALDAVLTSIERYGIPNYFGYQRFGHDEDNFDKAKEVAQGSMRMKDKKVQKIMVHAYQSYLFNDWLAKRIELSKEIDSLRDERLMELLHVEAKEVEALKNQSGLFRLLDGDIMVDSSTKRLVNVKHIKDVKKAFKERKLVPTGLIVGSKAWRAKALASKIEKPFDDDSVIADGERREAWVYPSKIKANYNQHDKIYALDFILPKGSYATVLLENLANRDLTPKKSIRAIK